MTVIEHSALPAASSARLGVIEEFVIQVVVARLTFKERFPVGGPGIRKRFS